MASEESMESLKVNLRSVVQSCKGGVLLSRLQTDYQNLIGKSIPFEDFNFRSLKDFLLSISDCVKLRSYGNGPVYVEAVANDSTTHLASLISKQKGTKSKKAQTSYTSSKKYGFHKAKMNGLSSSSSNVSVVSQSSNENIQIVKDLKSKLEKEQKNNQESTSEISRLKLELQTMAELLETERICSKNLQERIDIFEVSFEKEMKQGTERNNLLIKYHVQEIENLKMNLEKEKKLKEDYSSELKAERDITESLKKQINELQSYPREEYKKEIESLKSMLESSKALHKDRLRENEDLKLKLQKEMRINQGLSSTAEHLKKVAEANKNSYMAQIQRLEVQIKQLQEKNLLQRESVKSWSDVVVVDLSETDAAKELKANESATAIAQQLHTQKSTCDCTYNYERLDKETKILKQDIQKHSLDLKNTMKLQSKHYSTLDAKIKKHCDSIGVESILQKMLKHPLFLNSLKKSVVSIVDSEMSSKTVPNTPVRNVQNNPNENATPIKPLGIHQESANVTQKYVCPGVAAMNKKNKKRRRDEQSFKGSVESVCTTSSSSSMKS